MDIPALLFILVLLVPAFILVARMKRELGEQHSEKEWSRVQQQRHAVMRRHFDERRNQVWSEIDSAYLKFREREQIDAGGAPIATTHENTDALATPPNDSNKIPHS